MKTLSLLRAFAAAAAIAAVAPAAPAQTLLNAANVDVKVTLASKCRWATSAPTGLAVDFGNYTAFQVGANTGTTTTMTVECTRGFGTSPTVTWDTAGGSAAGVGVVAGLQYALSVSGGTPTAGTAASTTTIGTGDQIVYTLGGSMPALQAGSDQGGAQATATRTLTLTF